MPSTRSRHLHPNHASRDDVGPYADAVRIFLEAALDQVDPDDFARAPSRNVSTWLFSLGAVEALAMRLGISGRAALAIAVGAFEDFYHQDPVRAATIVGRLGELAKDSRWSGARTAGQQAMTDWLGGNGACAHKRLGELLETAPTAEAARFAEALLGGKASSDRAPERHAPSPLRGVARRPIAAPFASNH